MDEFQVTTEMVVGAGEAAGRVADTVTRLDLATPISTLAAALPGSRTAAVAGGPGAGWASGMPVLGGQVRQHADALGATAGAYRDADTAAAASMSGSSRPPATAGSARPI